MTTPHDVSRRHFLGGTLGLAAAGNLLAAAGSRAEEAPPPAAPATPARKIKLGLIGCGGRGNWIADLCRQHGGFEIHAVADYFPDRATAAGTRFGVDAARRFTGLSAYKRLLGAGVEAVAIESPPYFHPEQAAAAVAAGCHVYVAKPIAVDVPGCTTIEQSGRLATEKKLVFLVDFQTRADEFYIEALRRVQAGDLGKVVFAEGIYHADCPFSGQFGTLQKNPNDPATKLRTWGLDRVLSGDIITEQNIHTLDVVNWVMGAPPVHAVGSCGLTARPAIGTCADHFACYFQFPAGAGVTFSSKQFNGHDTKPDGIRVRAFGQKGVLETEYGGNVMLRGDNFYRGGKSPGIYQAGAQANIATFHRSIVEGVFDNPTVAPSVQSNLITLLGRTAAYRGELVTWKQLLAANERLEADLKGLAD